MYQHLGQFFKNKVEENLNQLMYRKVMLIRRKMQSKFKEKMF